MPCDWKVTGTSSTSDRFNLLVRRIKFVNRHFSYDI